MISAVVLRTEAKVLIVNESTSLESITESSSTLADLALDSKSNNDSSFTRTIIVLSEIAFRNIDYSKDYEP